MQASVRERQLTILDLPLDLLKRVVDAVDSIWHLHNLAQVGLVSRSVAAVIKQLQHITVFGRDLRKLYFKADRLSLEQFPLCLNFVTSLELQKVEADQASSMLQLASSCRGLMILDVCFQHVPQASLAGFEYLCLRGAASLQELHISDDSGIQLKVISPGGPLRQHDWLACITASSLSVLRGLGCCAAICNDMTDFNPLMTYQMTDQKIMSLFPALQWLEIGDEPLFTAFNSTVRGKLTNKTADTFLQATVGHVTGIYGRNSLIEMDLTRPLNSITSWHSESIASPRFISQLAPNLTVLNIKISHWTDACVVLTPKLVSVDVSTSRHVGAMEVEGVPTTALTHMCIKGHPLWLDKELYNWARARATQPHIVDLAVQVNLDASQRRVCMSSACCDTLVSGLCMDFSHGCVAVMTYNLPQVYVDNTWW